MKQHECQLVEVFILTTSACGPWIMKTLLILEGRCWYLDLLMLHTTPRTLLRKQVSALWQRFPIVANSIVSSWPGIKSTWCSFPWGYVGAVWWSMALGSGRKWGNFHLCCSDPMGGDPPDFLPCEEVKRWKQTPLHSFAWNTIVQTASTCLPGAPGWLFHLSVHLRFRS